MITALQHPQRTIRLSSVATIAHALSEQGWWCEHGVIDHSTAQLWRADLALRIWRHGHHAMIGRSQGLHRDRQRRGDRMWWLEDEPAAPWLPWLDTLEDLRLGLRQELRTGLNGIEAMASRYARGARYVRHVDQHEDSDHRVLSCVLYLNPDWLPGDGGELLVEGDDDDDISIEPQAGTCMIFRADMPHEVLPSRSSRYAITAWLTR